MQRKTRRIIAAVAVIALLAAGGAAFTASIGGVLDGTNANIGFGSQSVTGANATDVHYTLDSDGQYIDQVEVTLDHNFSSGYSFKGSLTDGTRNDAADTGSGVPVLSDPCTSVAPVYTSATDSTVVTCNFATSATDHTTGVPVNTVNGFQLSVIGNNDSGTSQQRAGESSVS
jgi:hypothetical protein